MSTETNRNLTATTNEIRVVCIQFAPQWEQPEENRAYLEKRIAKLDPVDLIILPEMFTTGFSKENNYIEPEAGETFVWMMELAKRYHTALMGSYKVAVDNKIYNRCYWITPDGNSEYYDKRHLFGAENSLITSGRQRKIVVYRGIRILLSVCYDLRFPVFCRNNDDYDVMINVASWPRPRIHHWNCLLQARAIENLSYVIGVNRIGEDGNGWEYSGETQIFSPDGEQLARAKLGKEDVIFQTMSLAKVNEVRESLPFLKDRDDFSLGLDVVGH